MKSLILMNPVKRRSRRARRSSGAVATRTRRRSRRSVRRNPTVKVRRTRHHSAAMRRKISLAVKRANRLRSSRRSVAVVRSAPRRSLRRRSSVRSFAVARRSSRRRSGGGGGFGGISIKSIFSKDILMTASGAISASFLTTWLLRTYGASLPMANSMAGRVVYKLAIPFVGAYAVNKFLKQRQVAQGMIIGGVVMAVNELIANFNRPAGAVAGASGYAGPADYASTMISGMNEDPDEFGEYFDGPADDALYSSASAFPDSAFAGN